MVLAGSAATPVALMGCRHEEDERHWSGALPAVEASPFVVLLAAVVVAVADDLAGERVVLGQAAAVGDVLAIVARPARGATGSARRCTARSASAHARALSARASAPPCASPSACRPATCRRARSSASRSSGVTIFGGSAGCAAATIASNRPVSAARTQLLLRRRGVRRLARRCLAPRALAARGAAGCPARWSWLLSLDLPALRLELLSSSATAWRCRWRGGDAPASG